MRGWSAVLALTLTAAAGSAEAESEGPAAGVDVFASSDADDTAVAKIGLNLDWRWAGPDDHQGLRVETVRFRPLGGDGVDDLRVYYQFADQTTDWVWKARLGTDGDTLLGAINLRDRSYRTEVFAEREIIETPQGLMRGLYYTFVGAASDIRLGGRSNLAIVGAVQAFTGRNERLHLRGNLVRELGEDWGLTAQIRARYFHSTRPGEFDYFSPRDHVQVMPTLQVRRRLNGWRYTVAAGLGAQRQTGGRWRSARALNAEIASPATAAGWSFNSTVAYSDTPTGAGYTYEYRQVSVALTRAF
ncbi:MAG: hypothetical protein ACOY5Y_09710 [Pseudomonadota bacterium]